MNKVLIICGAFFPVRNGGTIRCEKLVKYLPDNNWKSIVLTKNLNKSTKLDLSRNLKDCMIYRTRRYDFVSFFFNLKEKFKNSSFRILLVKKNKASKSRNIDKVPVMKRNISEYFIVPDSDIFWAFGAIRKALIILWREKPDIILSTGPCHSSHLLALFLKKITKKNWVVEFRDPWTMNPFNIPKPFKLLKLVDNYLEKIVLHNADKINVTSAHYKDQFLNKYKFLSPEKIVHIPNGYDPDDFKEVSGGMNEKFTIVHSGNFYQHRTSAGFVEAVLHLFKNKIFEEMNFEIKFLGSIDEQGRNLIENSKFIECFSFYGQVSHKESINEICNADLLLLIPGPGEGTMTGKVYEYMAASRPIFCIANDGLLKDLITKHNLGMVAKDNNKGEILKELTHLIDDIIKEKFIYPNNTDLKEKFSRKFIAGQMANVFKGVQAQSKG